MSQIVTRIAPSPTGYMHIGTARTALFNWLYARGRGGKFLLRIEDTDKVRSSTEATQAIFNGIKWLGLDFDGEPIHQGARAGRHAKIAHDLLQSGHAYKCFATQEEITTFRENARAAGRSTLFQSPWRDLNEKNHPNAPFVVRLKAPQNGQTVIHDQVQGDVMIRNDQLDDMVLLRSDGTPVYMLAVVVDDFDMGVTHVIRGDDHLNNAARQMLIYKALGWPIPVYAHVPLLFGEDGKKLSKRHGATGVEDYQRMGYPASGMRNYLTRLGWSHGDAEFFSDEEAKNWFDLKGIGKSPARFDFKKLQNLCGQHIAATNDAALLHNIIEFCAQFKLPYSQDDLKTKLKPALYCVKDRAKTLRELLDKSHFCLTARPIITDEKSKNMLDDNAVLLFKSLTPQLQNATWTRSGLESTCTSITEAFGVNFGKLAGPLRAALAGRTVTPSVFDMMLVLGKEESIARILDAERQVDT